jgi:hypothetical protein
MGQPTNNPQWLNTPMQQTHPCTGPAHIGPYCTLAVGPYWPQYGQYGLFIRRGLLMGLAMDQAMNQAMGQAMGQEILPKHLLYVTI